MLVPLFHRFVWPVGKAFTRKILGEVASIRLGDVVDLDSFL